MTHPTRQISISINRPMDDVYKFASNPENLPRWANGLSTSKMKKLNDTWIADSSLGQVKVKFAPDNTFGVLDHDVTLPSGEINHNPMRIVPNDQGSEVTFTLFQLPRISDADFEKDAQTILADLKKLKHVLENL